jgi:hypothetical protein
MGPKIIPPAEHAHRSLLRAFGSLKKVMEPYFAQFGISRPQWAVLIVLHRSEQEGAVGGMRLRDLGERLFIRPPASWIASFATGWSLAARRTTICACGASG